MPQFQKRSGRGSRSYSSASSCSSRKSGTYVIKSKSTGAKYVGRSANIPKRIEQHNSGSGSKWTSRMGNKGDWSLVKSYKGNNAHTENAITKGVMRNEGIASVRGGSYCKTHYPKAEFRAIKSANGFTNNGRGYKVC